MEASVPHIYHQKKKTVQGPAPHKISHYFCSDCFFWYIMLLYCRPLHSCNIPADTVGVYMVLHSMLIGTLLNFMAAIIPLWFLMTNHFASESFRENTRPLYWLNLRQITAQQQTSYKHHLYVPLILHCCLTFLQCFLHFFLNTIYQKLALVLLL